MCETSCHLCLPLPSRKKFRSHAPPLISLVLLQFIFVFASFFCLFFLRQGPSGVPVFSPLWRQGQRGSRVPAGGARGSAGRAGGRVDPSPPRAGRLLPPAQERRKGEEVYKVQLRRRRATRAPHALLLKKKCHPRTQKCQPPVYRSPGISKFFFSSMPFVRLAFYASFPSRPRAFLRVRVRSFCVPLFFCLKVLFRDTATLRRESKLAAAATVRRRAGQTGQAGQTGSADRPPTGANRAATQGPTQ